MLYHVSSPPDIKVLEPRVSTHGKAYVYAIENLVTGLLFGAKHDDFDFFNCRKKDFNEEKQGNLRIHRFENSTEYKQFISRHIVDRLIRFNALEYAKTDKRFQTHFQGLVDGLQSLMDGRLL